jgi:alpha-beta hydrolase superfamily lysophospholipase
MIKQNFKIENIPAILWGDKSDKLFIVVHGNMSNKESNIIVAFAKEATARGYQVLSFDLPEHGERKRENDDCKVQDGVRDLNIIMEYAKSLSNNISVFACSLGAYFSILTYKNETLKKCLFLSPVVDMEHMINNMMVGCNISENTLKEENEIKTNMGHTLYWDYYCYVKEHPIDEWNKPTSILYGSEDSICEFDVVSRFAKRFNCNLKIMENGKHSFHTEEQLQFFGQWLKGSI